MGNEQQAGMVSRSLSDYPMPGNPGSPYMRREAGASAEGSMPAPLPLGTGGMIDRINAQFANLGDAVLALENRLGPALLRHGNPSNSTSSSKDGEPIPDTEHGERLYELLCGLRALTERVSTITDAVRL